MKSLHFINSVTGTGVSNISMTNCFTEQFDSYMVQVSKLLCSTQANIDIRFIDNSDSVISDSDYCYATHQILSSGFSERKDNSGTSISRLIAFGSDNTNEGGSGYSYIINPYDSSSFTFTSGSSATVEGGNYNGDFQIGIHKVKERITGINLLTSGGTMDITVNMFGIKR